MHLSINKANGILVRVQHRVWARPDRMDQVDYAVSLGPLIQAHFDSLMGFSFPLPKLGKPQLSGSRRHWSNILSQPERKFCHLLNLTDLRFICTNIVQYYYVADHIGLPDFPYGAMENWGLITYIDTALLYDPATAGLNSQFRTAAIMAHEQAHQVSSKTELRRQGFHSYSYIALNLIRMIRSTV